MISCQQNQSIFCRYFNMRHYQNPAVNMRNHLATWTEQSVGISVFPQMMCPFLLEFCVCQFSRDVHCGQNLSQSFFIIKYLSIVTTATQFVLYVHGCKALIVYEKLWTSKETSHSEHQ